MAPIIAGFLGLTAPMDGTSEYLKEGGDLSQVAPKVISNIITDVFMIMGYVSIIFVIIGGIQYMAAAGDEGKMKSAKNTVVRALIGLVVAALAVAIVKLIGTIF
jgi:hypothetical protein